MQLVGGLVMVAAAGLIMWLFKPGGRAHTLMDKPYMGTVVPLIFTTLLVFGAMFVVLSASDLTS